MDTAPTKVEIRKRDIPPHLLKFFIFKRQNRWLLRNRICWCKQIFDFKERKTKGSVMPTSVKDRFNESWEYLYFFVKTKNYYSNLDAVRLKPQTFENRPDGFTRSNHEGGPGSWRDFKDDPENSNRNYQEKTKYEGRSPKPGAENLGYGTEIWRFYKERGGPMGNINGKNLPTCWLIGSEPHNFKNELGVETDHFATFPKALLEIPIKFGCPPKGIILDPFMGSGQTALMARQLGRNFIGIDLSPAYVKLAQARLRQDILPI